MCGIGFFINYGEKKIDLDLIKKTWEEMEDRGTDASGIYYERKDGTRTLLKAPVKSSDLWDMIVTEKSLKSKKLNGTENLIILHTRNKTEGSQHDNNNNMPIYSSNYILAHNGVVSALTKKPKYKFKGEVDSEFILANVEKNGIYKGIKDTDGSKALILKPFASDNIYIYRDTNPLDVAYIHKQQLLIGISKIEFTGTSLMINPKDIFSSQPNLLCLPKHEIHCISTMKKEIKLLEKINFKAGKK